MNPSFARNAAVVATGAAALVWNTMAAAQTVVMQPQPAPQPATPVVVAPAAVQAAPPAPSPSQSTVVVGGGGAPVADEPVHPFTRPNRGLLMTGLIAFGVPYIASISVAATSPHVGDSNLWVPVLGPWLDLGARGGCPTNNNNNNTNNNDCGAETGNKVLLVADGIFQTVGALEIAGAFIFPETYGAATIRTSRSGGWVAFTPSRVGAGYGVSAAGAF